MFGGWLSFCPFVPTPTLLPAPHGACAPPLCPVAGPYLEGPKAEAQQLSWLPVVRCWLLAHRVKPQPLEVGLEIRPRKVCLDGRWRLLRVRVSVSVCVPTCDCACVMLVAKRSPRERTSPPLPSPGHSAATLGHFLPSNLQSHFWDSLAAPGVLS